MKQVFYITIIGVLLLACNSCKKSDNDPVFSTKSRHKRACGEWVVKSGSITSTFVDKNNQSSSVTYSLTQNGFSADITGKGTLVGKFSMNLSVNTDDTFSLTQVFDAPSETTKGTWQFLKKTGDFKNKEQISFTLDPGSSTSLSLFSFSKGGFSYVYAIDELSNDNKMVLVCNKELVLAEANSGKTDRFYITAKYVLEK